MYKKKRGVGIYSGIFEALWWGEITGTIKDRDSSGINVVYPEISEFQLVVSGVEVV